MNKRGQEQINPIVQDGSFIWKKLVVGLIILIVVVGIVFAVWKFLPETTPTPTPSPSPSGNLSDYEDSPFGMEEYDSVYSLDLRQKWSMVGFRQPLIQINNKETGGQVEYDFSSPLKNGPSYDSWIISYPRGFYLWADIKPNSGDAGQIISYLPYSSSDLSLYSDFIKKIINRYNGDGTDDVLGLKVPITYWGINSEPATGRNYSVLFDFTCPLIKQVDSDAKVSIGAFGAFGACSTVDCDQTKDVGASLYEDILKPLKQSLCMDIFDIHFYNNNRGDYRSFKQIYEYFRQKLDEKGLNNVEIWSTGTSSFSGCVTAKAGFLPGEPNCHSEAFQSSDIIKTYTYWISLGVKKIFLGYAPKEVLEEAGISGSGADNYWSNTGLVYDGLGKYDLGAGVKKLSYYSYKLMVEKLEGSDWDNVQEVYNQNNVYAYKFVNKQTQKPIYVVWWDYWKEPSLTTKQVSIPVSITGTVKITQSVPHFENGLLLQNSGEVYPNFFDVENKEVSGGQVTFTLGQNPVYIEQD